MIDLQSHLAKNSLWMILSRFAAQGSAVVFTILLARRLGSSAFGEYAFIAAVIFVANALTTFGTDMLLIREIAAKDDLSGLPMALILQLVLSFLFIAFVWLFGNWIPNQGDETITALKIYGLAFIPLAFFTVFTTALRGKQLMGAYGLLNIILPLLQIGAVLLLHEKNLILLFSFLLFAQILVVLFAGLLCSFVIPHFWRLFRLSSLRRGSGHDFLLAFYSSFLKAAPIAWLTLLGMIYQRINIYLLSTMNGATETGMYAAAFRVVEASKTAHMAVFAALYPAMAQDLSLRPAKRESNVRAEETTASPGFNTSETSIRYARPSPAITYLTSSAIVISFSLFLLAKPLTIFLYGSEYSSSVYVLRILAWILIPFTVNTYLTLSFLASNQERIIGRALIGSLLGLLILNLWWIPVKGPEGSAWAALIAECIQSFILFVGARAMVRVQGPAHEFPELS